MVPNIAMLYQYFNLGTLLINLSIAINTNHSIQHYSFICTRLNGSKFCYVSIFTQPLRLGRIWHKVNF